MPISTSTVFHFTNSSENLINILEHTFHPHFCLEDLNVIAPDSTDYPQLVFAIPMVSFCDIPLSQVLPHLKNYGYYGIGLSKAWAIKSGLCPIHYIVRHSPLALTLSSIQKHLNTLQNEINDNSFAVDSFYDFSCFLKAYEEVSPQGVKRKSRRFYDEREWRFVPNLTGLSYHYRYGMPKGDFSDKNKRAAANDYLWNNSKLPFSPNDIRYIIVRREEEILDMIQRIRLIKDPFPEDQVQLLASRIISSSQIRNDF